MLATAPTTAAALAVLPPADIAWTYKTNQTLGETIGRAGRGALPPAELGRPGPPVPAYVTWAAEEVSHGVLYALFAGGGSGAYAESAAPDPGSCPREYGGSSAGSGFSASGPVPARYQAKDDESPGRPHALRSAR